MTCNTISDANPDIAGIGIILAFGLQALISLLLSAIARVLLSKKFPLIGWDRKRVWKQLLGKDDSYSVPITEEEKSILGNTLRRMLGGTSVRPAIETVDPRGTELPNARKAAIAIAEGLVKSIIVYMSDVVDPSWFLSDEMSHMIDSYHLTHIIESTRLSHIIDSARREVAAKNRRNRIRSEFSKGLTNRQEKMQELIFKVLLVASDGQTLTGIALTITAMVQQRSLSLYHLHVIYDTINFTTVSNIAAISCIYDNHLESHRVRYTCISIFGLLYSGFTIMLGIRLNDWNDEVPGRCYRASNIALPNAKHPFIDQVYLAVTSFYVLNLFFLAAIACRASMVRLYLQKSIIILGTLQYTLHVYILVALRVSNQPLLDNLALEEQWGFGQVIAIIMLVATLLECAKGLEEYFSWKKKEIVGLREKVKLEGRQATLIHSKTFP